MVVVGCLALLVFPILGLIAGGLIAGGLIAGRTGAEWGAGVGLILALALCGTTGSMLIKAARKRV